MEQALADDSKKGAASKKVGESSYLAELHIESSLALNHLYCILK